MPKIKTIDRKMQTIISKILFLFDFSGEYNVLSGIFIEGGIKFMDLVLAIVLIAAALIIGAAVSGFICFRLGIEHRKRDEEAQIESAEKEAQRIVS